jgi:hypothetical protein
VTVTFAGTVAADVLLLVSDTTALPVGAAALSVTVPCTDVPATTDAGLSDTLASAAVVVVGVPGVLSFEQPLWTTIASTIAAPTTFTVEVRVKDMSSIIADTSRGNVRTRRRCASLLIGIAATLLAGDAAAQSVVVTAGAFREIKRFSGDPELNVLDSDSRGGQFAVGAIVVPRCVVALEIGAGSESDVTRSTSVAFAGQTIDLHTLYTSQLTTWSVLAGLRGPLTGRLQITYFGGLTFAHLLRHITPEAQSPILNPAPPATTSTTIDDVAGPAVGVDAAIRATSHVAVVFFARAHGLRVSSDLSGFAIRPGVAAQFSF